MPQLQIQHKVTFLIPAYILNSGTKSDSCGCTENQNVLAWRGSYLYVFQGHLDTNYMSIDTSM